ncbi:NAD(P)-binding protein [Amycolatopsis magusensis]|uniref:NAD(P)-binding protein n=1 Tax=Amycolatopsis magusensis TaxID=882444 RepID=UPI0024A965E2|nr:NAD(P)-binding protein [Amycolatopsis magusensis]MDI5976485.1 NAD-binding protein [Amycolatopsis magusensis]
MSGHTVVIGFGSVGLGATRLLLRGGVEPGDVTVVDHHPPAIEEAAALGVRALLGDGGDRWVLRRAGTGDAASVVIAVQPDASVMLITMAVRELCGPEAVVVAAIGEHAHARFLRRCGASEVIVFAETAGGAMAAAALGRRTTPLTEAKTGWTAQSRPVQSSEIGLRTGECGPAVVGVLRNGTWRVGPEAASLRLAAGDRVVVLRRTSE